MKTLSLRGVDDDLADSLKKIAKKTGTSLNKTVLEIIRQSIGSSPKPREMVYRDLDNLAGTWTEKDLQQFKKTTKHFEVIDKGLWK